MKKTLASAAAIVFFDDERGLQRCMDSIHNYADLRKFRYFEDDHDTSIDDSRKVVQSFPNAVYYCYPNLQRMW